MPGNGLFMRGRPLNDGFLVDDVYDTLRPEYCEGHPMKCAPLPPHELPLSSGTVFFVRNHLTKTNVKRHLLPNPDPPIA